MFEGSCRRALVCEWLKTRLLPRLAPGSTLILDNATFHKGAELEAIVAAAGCQLLYLPAYSPDLNPIEGFWSPLKLWMKRHMAQFESLFDCVLSAFRACSFVSL